MRSLRSEQEIIKNWKGDASKPLVSICCLAYNHEPYIEDSLEGFLIQRTNFPFEILIHDDASTDRTADIIREHEKKYPDIFVCIYQKDNQYSKGTKILLKYVFPRARGKYVAFCEGDDYWTDPMKLQKQVATLDKHANVFICGHWANIIDEYGNQNGTYGKTCPERFSIRHSLKGTVLHPNSWLFRSIDWQHQKNYELVTRLPAGDDPMMLLLLSRGEGFCLKEVCSVYRIHKGGTWSSQLQYKKNFKMLQFIMASFSMISSKYYLRQYFNLMSISFYTLTSFLMSYLKNQEGVKFLDFMKLIQEQRTMKVYHFCIVLVCAFLFFPIGMIRKLQKIFMKTIRRNS